MWPQWESQIGMPFGLRRSMPAASSSRREGEQDPSILPCGSPPWYSGDRSDLIDSDLSTISFRFELSTISFRFELSTISFRFTSVRLDSVRLTSDRFSSGQFGSVWIGLSRLGSARLDLIRVVSGRTDPFGSTRTRSTRIGSALLISAQLGPTSPGGLSHSPCGLMDG